MTDALRRELRFSAAAGLRAAASGELALRLSPRYLDEHCLLPLGIGDDGALITAVGRALDPTVTDELSRLFRRPLRLVQHPAAEIQAAVLAARRADAEIDRRRRAGRRASHSGRTLRSTTCARSQRRRRSSSS